MTALAASSGWSSSVIDDHRAGGARRMLAEPCSPRLIPTSPSSAPSATSGAAVWWCDTAPSGPRILTSEGWGWCRPRVNDRRIDPTTGERGKFSRRSCPPWCLKTPRSMRVCRAYLHGLFHCDFGPALGQFPSPPRAVQLGDHKLTRPGGPSSAPSLPGTVHVDTVPVGRRRGCPRGAALRVGCERPPPSGCVGSPMKWGSLIRERPERGEQP